MTQTPEQIAAGLTADEKTMLGCLESGYGQSIAYRASQAGLDMSASRSACIALRDNQLCAISAGFDEDDGMLVGSFYMLTPLGLAVRAVLERGDG